MVLCAVFWTISVLMQCAGAEADATKVVRCDSICFFQCEPRGAETGKCLVVVGGWVLAVGAMARGGAPLFFSGEGLWGYRRPILPLMP